MELMKLIQRIKRKDQEAFRLLFEQYKNLVYRTAYLMLNDEYEAEDALQEVFVQVYRSISSYEPAKGAFTTWLYRITSNHCQNRRRRKKFSLVPLSWFQLRADKGSTRLDSRLEQNEPIQKALQNLNDKVRDTVILRYYGELSYAEIAESLEIPIGTVKSRLNMGLKMLQRELELTDANPGLDQEEVLR